jgi:hypothetical protein
LKERGAFQILADLKAAAETQSHQEKKAVKDDLVLVKVVWDV